jgi:NADH-quinone oxidoreductase subunit G
MSCMTPVADGHAHRLVDDQDSKEFRGNVIEWMMTNHPHDCPVCDEGGECHLQDMTLMTGHNYRDYRFEKRTFRNQDLGPFINHEMNRCIQCYRCVRYYKDYAGGTIWTLSPSATARISAATKTAPLESEFSGNLVEVCPTGVFTDKTLKQHYARRWDFYDRTVGLRPLRAGLQHHAGRALRQAPAHPQSLQRRGERLFPLRPRPLRLRIREQRAEALGEIGALLRDQSRAIGIGSPRASLESNFALRELVGEDRFYMALNEDDRDLLLLTLDILCNGGVETPSLRDIGEAEAVLVLGEDLTNVAPMMALQVRQAVRNVPRELTRKMGHPRLERYRCARGGAGRHRPVLQRHGRRDQAGRRRHQDIPRGAAGHSAPGLRHCARH